jgi:hypothetical protein
LASTSINRFVEDIADKGVGAPDVVFVVIAPAKLTKLSGVGNSGGTRDGGIVPTATFFILGMPSF